MAGNEMRPRIELLIRSPELRTAVETYLRSSLPVEVLPYLNEAGPNVVVIATSSDLAPADCERLVGGGARVLVLQVFASEALADAYRLAGADKVVLMGDERTPLVEAVRATLPTSSQQD